MGVGGVGVEWKSSGVWVGVGVGMEWVSSGVGRWSGCLSGGRVEALGRVGVGVGVEWESVSDRGVKYNWFALKGPHGKGRGNG